MATPAQLEANRANAQLSTGPSTDEGKAKSSANSLRHGLAARGFIVLPGQESAFEKLEDGLRANLAPFGELQQTLFTRILESAWNLHRCRLAATELYLNAADSGVDPLVNDEIEAKHARIQKYARQSESSLIKTMAELSKLQTDELYRHQVHPITEQDIANPELFAQTPQALSDLCQFQKVHASLARQQKRSPANRRPKSKETNAALLEMLDKLESRPIQNEANQAENVIIATAA